MKNNKTSISANEINKFTYCNYQWYYGKLYGNSYIMKKYNQRNEMFNMKDTTFSNLKNGLKTHKNYAFTEKVKLVIKIAVLLLLLIGVCYVYTIFR